MSALQRTPPSASRRRRFRIAPVLVLLLAALPAAGQGMPRGTAADSWEITRAVRPLDARVLPSGVNYAAGEWLVGLRDPAAVLDVIAAAEQRGGRLVGEVPRLAMLALDAPDDSPLFGAALLARDDVVWVSRNGIGAGGGVPPSDTFFASQWHLNNTGQSGGLPDADVDALEAWDLELGDSGVTLAVLDTGIDFTHLEFVGRTAPGYDFVNEDADPTADHNHGIWVTGLAAANGNNSLQVAGIDRGCTIVPVKVLDQFNGGTELDLIQGLDYCATQGVDIVSMSLINFPASPGLAAALQAARDADCILLACAGNFGIGNADISWPGASPLTMSIGATTDLDERAGFSGTGNALDFVAPGANVSTVEPGLGDGFDLFSGCSASTPVAAGIAGLLLARYPGIDHACVEELLRAGAEDQVGKPSEDTAGWDPFHGYGRLNAFASLTVASPCQGQSVLTASPATVELSGGTQNLALDAGSPHAGEFYVVLGSATGTSPPLQVGAYPLPLVFDGYSQFTLTSGAGIVLLGSVGFLDATGAAAAQFQLPLGASPGLFGVTLFHAAVSFDATLVASGASNATSVLLVDTTTVLDEDFETGGAGWSFNNSFGGLWHVTQAAECSAASRVLAFHDGPANCAYNTNLINLGQANSPTFSLQGIPPYRVSFDAVLDFDTTGAGQDSATLTLVEVGGGGASVLLWSAAGLPAGTAAQSFDIAVPTPAGWTGLTARLEFDFTRGTGGDLGAGFTVDQVKVTTASP